MLVRVHSIKLFGGRTTLYIFLYSNPVQLAIALACVSDVIVSFQFALSLRLIFRQHTAYFTITISEFVRQSRNKSRLSLFLFLTERTKQTDNTKPIL